MALMRYYLDYNSTHPIDSSVLNSISKDLDFDANPSSQHTSGKAALKLVNDTTKYLQKFFNTDYDVLYHSGATEFFNTIFSAQNCDTLIFSQCDHSAIHKIAKNREQMGASVLKLGHLTSQADWINLATEFAADKQNTWFNFQWMNNETGEVLPSSMIAEIKTSINCLVHIDAVQTVGKIKEFQKLPPEADVITFSGHKFGALKGIGFSFVKQGLDIRPLILGGGQQKSLRSGTINTHGIISLKAALEARKFDLESEGLKSLKERIIELVNKFENLSYIPNDSLNTICLIHKKINSDALLVHFDLEKLDVGTGSACTSGSLDPSQTLLAMGFKEGASQNIRLSLGASNIGNEGVILEKLERVFKKL